MLKLSVYCIVTILELLSVETFKCANLSITLKCKMEKESLISWNEYKCQNGDLPFIVNYLAFTVCSQAF